ncbi:MAG TPA: hypothetical protein VKR80_01340 [Candidatus Limnocylindria bacterium]|nr:hypothetical protein [Candidatus Limnocylindria bacterium]
MGLAPFALIVVLSAAAGIAVQVLGGTKSRYDALIVGVTAVFGMYFASESFPGSTLFSTITSFGPVWDGFVIVPGLVFGFVIATIAYIGTRETYRASTASA